MSTLASLENNLYEGVIRGDLPVVKDTLTQLQADYNYNCSHYERTLKLAAKYNRLNVVKHLLEQGCDVNGIYKPPPHILRNHILVGTYLSLIWIAFLFFNIMISGLPPTFFNLSFVKELLRLPASLACTQDNSAKATFFLLILWGLLLSAFIVAGLFISLPLSVILLEYHIAPFFTYSNEDAPLVIAAAQGHTVIINYLLEKGANPKATTQTSKNTILHLAVQYEHLHLLDILRKKNLVSVHTKNKLTPQARFFLFKATAYKLFRTNFIDQGYTARELAVHHNKLESLQYLARYSDITQKFNLSTTYRHYSRLIWLLLVEGVEPRLTLFTLFRIPSTHTRHLEDIQPARRLPLEIWISIATFHFFYTHTQQVKQFQYLVNFVICQSLQHDTTYSPISPQRECAYDNLYINERSSARLMEQIYTGISAIAYHSNIYLKNTAKNSHDY